MGGVGLQMTIDGGRTVQTDAAASVIHDDIHAIWINPANSNHILIGNDGGVAVSYDMSQTWTYLPNLPLALFYHVGYDMAMPYNVCGGMQDNYNWCGPSATRFTRGIMNYDWFQVQGGDGFVALLDPRNPRIVYTESQDGNIDAQEHRDRRVARAFGRRRRTSTPDAAGEQPFRFNWDTPMIFSPHEPGTLLVAANRVFRSTDRGDSWTVISPDLTTNADRNEIVTWACAATRSASRERRHRGVADDRLARRIAEAAGSVLTPARDDGVVSVSQDGGKTWTNITDEPARISRRRLGVRSRAVAIRRRHGLCDGRRAPAERLQDLHLGEQRLRRDVPVDQRATSRAKSCKTLTEDHEESGRALHRHGDRHLPHARSRQELAAAQGEPPDRARRRDHDSPARQRDDRRHARPRRSGSSITSSRSRNTRRRRRPRTPSCSRPARRCSGARRTTRTTSSGDTSSSSARTRRPTRSSSST